VQCESRPLSRWRSVTPRAPRRTIKRRDRGKALLIARTRDAAGGSCKRKLIQTRSAAVEKRSSSSATINIVNDGTTAARARRVLVIENDGETTTGRRKRQTS
jgi:hypothetical protein